MNEIQETLVICRAKSTQCVEGERRVFAGPKAAETWARSQWTPGAITLQGGGYYDWRGEKGEPLCRIQPATIRELFPRLDRKCGHIITER